MALDLKPGDEVITATFTYVATAEVIALLKLKPVLVDVDPDTPMLWVLRDELDLVGTKFGCGIAQCGACTVHLNGTAVRSCQLPVSALGEGEITTIEGLSKKAKEAEHAVQQAWLEHDVPQCGYCQAGQIMNAASFLATNPNPTDQQIESAFMI